jgi:hypothetical protein
MFKFCGFDFHSADEASGKQIIGFINLHPFLYMYVRDLVCCLNVYYSSTLCKLHHDFLPHIFLLLFLDSAWCQVITIVIVVSLGL